MAISKASSRSKSKPAPTSQAVSPLGDTIEDTREAILKQLDAICTQQNRLAGQLVTALVLRRISKRLLTEQITQVEGILIKLNDLLSTINKAG